MQGKEFAPKIIFLKCFLSSTTHLCYARAVGSKTGSSMAVKHLLQEVVSWPHPKDDIGAINWLLVKDDVEDAANFLRISKKIFKNKKFPDGWYYMKLCIYWHHDYVN